MSAARPWLGLALIGATACSMITNLSSLATDAATTTDAATDDVVTSDVIGEEVGTPDAAPAVCNGAELVSDDFDNAPLGSSWNAMTGSGATMTIDSAESVSTPSSLLVSVPGDGGTAALRKGMSSKHVCCEWDVELGAINGRTFKLSGQQGNYAIELSTSTTVSQILEDYYTGNDAGIIRYLGVSLPPDAKWHHVVIDTQFPIGPGAGKISMKVDENLSLQDTVGGAAFDLSFDNVYVGVTYAGQSAQTPRTVRVDNFRCTTQ